MEIRPATPDDLPAIVAMLADDPIGATRERYAEPLPTEYRQAFDAIEAQQGNVVLVATDGDAVIGCLQLTFIPGLARLGMTRAQIEAVRVHKDHRNRNIGAALFRDAIERARAQGCGLVQLTADRARPDALRFYERLGFVASHVGLKLSLVEPL